MKNYKKKSQTISTRALSFFITGLDEDLYSAQREDLRSVTKVEAELTSVRKSKSA